MKVAVVGATGLVGGVMLKILDVHNFPLDELIPVASERSVGKSVNYKGKEYKIIGLAEAMERKPDIALFSAGGSTSKEWAPRFAEAGTTVVDNSSAWRMDPTKKLIVPEINANELTKTDKIIANPNCSTIQMVLPLWPLHQKYGIRRLVVSTYQSVTGSGVKAVRQMENERRGEKGEMAYPHPIDRNCMPQVDVFEDNGEGYTKEEWKMVNETRKIFSEPDINITTTCVRIPVTGGHSEAVNVEFEKDFEPADVRQLLESTPGVVVRDDPQNSLYPLCLDADGHDEVFVGRIRRDLSQPRSLNLWIVADNLRKGAATNTVQIAEYLVKEGLV
jgi:aspartate-semialdehyde dehydrogenase